MKIEEIIDRTNKIIPFAEFGEANTQISSNRGVWSEVELRSDEVQEILTRPPHTLVRYGISVLCGALLLLFIGSFFFKYPDVVSGEVVITTENPPVWLVAKSTGKIKELLCSDKQGVKQGVALAVIENSASTIDVLSVQKLLATVIISDSTFYFPKQLLTKSFDLGVLQSNFSAFTKVAMNYDNFTTLNLTLQGKASLQKQIANRKIYLTNLQKQWEMKKQELVISKSAYNRDKILFSQRVISISDMETADQTYLNQQQALQQLQTTISLEDVNYSELKESINKLSIQYLLEKHQLFSDLKSTHRELLAAIINWQQTYMIIASQSGVVTFNTFWKQNQNINSGDKVFAIVSHNPGKLIGKIKVPALGVGKIQIGQKVNIKVTGYPYMEYGLLQAKIRNISLVSNNDFFSIEVEFPKGLHSNVNKQMKFTGEMIGIAEIVTENRTLIERIYSPLKFLANKSFE